MVEFSNLGQEPRPTSIVQHAHFLSARYFSPFYAYKVEFRTNGVGEDLTIGFVDWTLFEPV
jgi:hypothetical protein